MTAPTPARRTPERGASGGPGRPALLPPALLLLLALLAGPATGEPGEASASAWRDEAVLSKRFAEAVAAVEADRGAAFVRRPTCRRSTKVEVARILGEELAAQLEAAGEASGEAAMLATASMLLAKYDADARVVHVLPDNVERIAGLLGEPRLASEGLLRVILAHEAVHALDFERHPLEEERRRRTTSDGMLAYGAAVEGHAQWVAERLARGWGLGEEFEVYVRCISAVPEGLEPAERLVAAANAAYAAFAYVKGLAFVKAVEAARGSAGVEGILRSPPRTTREVERPDLWLEPGRAEAGVDAKAVFAVLVAALGEGWTVRVVPALASALESQLATIPEEERRAVLAAYEEGQVVVLSNASGSQAVIGFVGRLADADAAERFDRANRAVLRAKDDLLRTGAVRITSAEYGEGVGKGRARPGLRARKVVASPQGEQVVRASLARVGRHVLEVSVVDVASLSDDAVDAAVEAACVALEPPPAGR